MSKKSDITKKQHYIPQVYLRGFSPEYHKGDIRLSKEYTIYFWDKGQNLTMSDGELAYTSFDRVLRRIIINRVELLKQKTFHPTEKPIKLYEWVLLHYAQPGQKILDTHGGSMSHAIAAHKLGFDLTIIEKDPVYYEQAKKRLIEFQRQQVLF